MASRPSSTKSWASSADSEDVSEPSDERNEGYKKEESLPHDQFNWLLRELWKWIDYLDGFNSGGKIPIYDDSVVAWGDNGDLDNPSDTSSLFEVQLENTSGGTARFRTGQVSVADVLATLIKARTGSRIDVDDDQGNPGGFSLAQLQAAASDYIEILDDQGNPGGLNTTKINPAASLLEIVDSGGTYYDLKGSILEATTHLLSDVLKPITDDWIAVEDDQGTTGAGGFILDKLQQNIDAPIDIHDETPTSGAGGLLLSYLRQSAQNKIIVEDSNGNEGAGRFSAWSAPKVLGAFTVDSATPALNPTGGGYSGNSTSISGTYQNTGRYDIDIGGGASSTDNIIPFVQKMDTATGSNPGQRQVSAIVTSTNTLRIEVTDGSGTYVDLDKFSVAIYHQS